MTTDHAETTLSDGGWSPRASSRMGAWNRQVASRGSAASPPDVLKSATSAASPAPVAEDSTLDSDPVVFQSTRRRGHDKVTDQLR